MADPTFKWYPILDFTGGRNAADDPLSIADNQVVQMRNGDTYRTRLFRKRPGASAPNIGSAFTGVISSLLAHFPSNNPAAAELWGCDDAATPILGRMAAASTFATVTQKDTPASGAGPKVRGASYNGKLFLCYDSAADRSQVYDPTLAAPAVRRVGLSTPAAPTVANQGAGTLAATTTYGRVRYRIKNGSVVVAQSEPSASQSFTPSGTGQYRRWTKPASISESETHWVLEESSDDITFYEVAETAVGTAIYDDSTTVSALSAGNLSPVLGAYAPPKSHKYPLAAFNRMLWMGCYETGSGNFQSAIYYTPAKGSSDKGDDERVPDTLFTRYRLDVGEGTGGDGTGLAGPMYGGVWVFKYNAIKKIIPTGLAAPVWEVVDVSNTSGAIEQECIAVGQDAQKRPAIYYLDPQLGPMVVGPVPPTPIGAGVQDLWSVDDVPVVNLAATAKVGWVLDAKDTVLFAWATGANNDPNVIAEYTKNTGGWDVWDTGGTLRLSRCAVMFARTLGASMSRDKVPYFGYASANNTLHRGKTTDTDDAGTTFQALVKSRPYNFNNGQPCRISRLILIAKPASGVTLTVTVDADFGRETRAYTVSLTASASEASATRIVRGIDIETTDATWIQIQIGDAAAIANGWQIERLYVAAMPLASEGGV